MTEEETCRTLLLKPVEIPQWESTPHITKWKPEPLASTVKRKMSFYKDDYNNYVKKECGSGRVLEPRYLYRAKIEPDQARVQDNVIFQFLTKSSCVL